ncbi:MAG: ABC transporter substrate-binding protein [Alphaproteobacteria bacterium]|nr:ABC transporter substrate-binding protein [Alphaproteobacteria bacterium]
MGSIARAALLAALLSAASAAADTITVATNADIRSTNPGVNRDDNTDAVILHIVEGLVAYREDGTVGPLLADAVEPSEDGRTYSFRLRRGIRFHNGAEMTSADVLWSWNRLMEPRTDWRCRNEFDGRGLFKVEAVAAPDPATVTMRIDRPSALFLATLARTDCGMTAVIHRDSVAADGSWVKPIGTGPFRLGDWRKGQQVVLERFADYAARPGPRDGYTGGKQALVEQVKFLVVPDPSTVKAALLSGAVDISDVPDADARDLAANPAVTLKSAPTPVMHGILLQTRDPVLANPGMRRAIAAAVDTEEIVAAVSNGLGRPNNSVVSTASAFHGAVERQGFRHDPELARRLLREAGYRGEPIRLIANKRAVVPSFAVAVIAQAMLQAVGLNVEIEVMEWATQLDRYAKGSFQMMSFSYSARFDPALSFEQISGPKDKQPRKVWEDAEALALLERAMTVTDPPERQKLFDALHRRYLETVPMIVLYNGADSVVFSKRIVGYEPWLGAKPRLWGVRRTG